MDSIVSLAVTPDGPDQLLARLQDNFTRQKRQVAAQKRKQVDLELQTAAAYYSDLPATLELLSDGTVSLFNELERLLEAKLDGPNGPNQEVALLQRIRQLANRELRESMSFIEEGYTSSFQKLMREGRFDEKPAAKDASLSPETRKRDDTLCSDAPGTPAAAPYYSNSVAIPLQEALSESMSLMAESLAVLLQCEVVRVYLYDANAHLQRVAQFPYHATRADPMQSTYLAMMAVREVHQIVCRERLAVNGGVGKPQAPAHDGAAGTRDRHEEGGSGLEDILTCLLLPIFSPNGAGKPYGMVHAVNKHCITALAGASDKTGLDAHLGFTAEDETLAASVARVMGTILSRYPVGTLNPEVGERLRRSAFPRDAAVLSLTAHLPPTLVDEVQEAAEVGQRALALLTPILVHRAPMEAIYEARTAAGDGRRRKLERLGLRNGALSSVEFNLRCMNELWESSRDDNVAQHKQYRALEEEVRNTRLLLHNVLDGVAAARAMPLCNDVAHYLHNLEMYGRSERTERMATYVSEQMLAIPALVARNSASGTDEVPTADSVAPSDVLTGAELAVLRNHQARLNTMTPASLHLEGPNGVRAYTSDPAQKREQVRFIDELCRRAREEVSVGTTSLSRASGSRKTAPPSTFPPLSRSGAARPVKAQPDKYPFQRPFQL